MSEGSGLCKYWNIYRSGTVNSNTVNSEFHLIQIFGQIFFSHILIILWLKCTVNSNSIYFKGNLADEWLRNNRAWPVVVSVDTQAS